MQLCGVYLFKAIFSSFCYISNQLAMYCASHAKTKSQTNIQMHKGQSSSCINDPCMLLSIHIKHNIYVQIEAQT